MDIGELLTVTHSLAGAHLGHALDSLFECRVKHPIIENRRSVSIIVHAFSGLESLVNLIGTQLFFDRDSGFYILEENRDYALKRLIQKWDTMPALGKIDLILSQTQEANLPPHLRSQLGELNNLRNWVVHGFIYRETVLLEPKGEGEKGYALIDKEVHVNWAEKFPTTKFKILEELNKDDACLALKICLETAKFICTAFHYLVVVIRLLPDGKITGVFISEDCDVSKIISSACAGEEYMEEPSPKNQI